MDRKPTVLLEAWHLFLPGGSPQLMGYATGHPRLAEFRRYIATSRVIRMDHARREAETLNTVYRLRRRLTNIQVDRDGPVQLTLCHLRAERQLEMDRWSISDDRHLLAANLSSTTVVILTMLSMLDREGFDDSHA